MIIRRDGVVKLHRRLRDKVKHRRGIHRHAERLISRRINFRRRQTAQIREAIAEFTPDRHHQLDLADAVFETDEVRATFRQFDQRVRLQTTRPAVVNDDAQFHRATHRLDVRRESLLPCFRQIMREQQNPLRAEALSFLRKGDRLPRRAAGTGDNRYAIATGRDRGADHRAVVLRRQRKKFSRPSRRK